MNIRVSVVVPARNQESGLDELFESLREAANESALLSEVVVVDDNSNPPITLPPGFSDVPIRLVRLQGEGNRSAARNAGARVCTGTHLFFVDCDCKPSLRLLDLLASAFRTPETVGAGGAVNGAGEGFWHRYQARGLTDRSRRATIHPTLAVTAANLMVERTAFFSIGGFDEQYTGYGFEDRDLVLRLGSIGTVQYMSDAVIEHRDALTLSDVTRKMFDAGRNTGSLFAARHRRSYDNLGYGRIDAALHPWLTPIALSLGPAAMRSAPLLDSLLARDALPFWLSWRIAKACSALAFLYGTASRSKAL